MKKIFIVITVLFCVFTGTAYCDDGDDYNRRIGEKLFCNKLEEIKIIPIKKEPVNDPIYNGLRVMGQLAIPCLIDKITDVSTMKDPRSVPGSGIAYVGDVAFYILLDITNKKYTDFLPEPYKAKSKEQGIYAYYEYVENIKNRYELQRKLKAILTKNDKKDANKRGRRE